MPMWIIAPVVVCGLIAAGLFVLYLAHKIRKADV